MKIITSSRVFKMTYPLIVAFDKRIPDVDDLKKVINMTLQSSEFWIESIERVAYENDDQNALQFNFRITRVMPIDADVARLETIAKIAVELEHTLMLELTERGIE